MKHRRILVLDFMNTAANPVKPMACKDSHGTLPECAPLAVPYVPFQQRGSKRYEVNEALNNGTLFEALNLPFRVKKDARNVVNGPLSELQALEFVLVELGQYLDTHSDDMEAFSLFQEYVALEKKARESYEEAYGPLRKTSAANDNTYTWLKDPWPWNYPEGGGK